ncbi:ribosome recycling factor [Cardinium endosymbiont of Culicoides punctatus]|uniref:ribosome recycling factor n=1 Tax=Cardinium endosymbiont of Culicoides punctatus TaxID=2304601 RepID=UPI001058E2FF|nr:ribosome recycling factor [Cardinium endosymbiont of Culicoides punctatus]TDG93348.1 Ribosome-recycling factor [Cardinium endosymbiont of Culicoides punctatus]
MEVVQQHLDDAKHNMAKAYLCTQEAFAKVNAGRAVPAMLQGLMVTYYGNPTPLNQLASISATDARTLIVQPWEQKSIPHIEKAISESQLGFSTRNDGRMVIVTLPPSSEERRKNLVKLVKNEAEKGRIVIRNVRRDYKEILKTMQKDGIPEDEIKRSEKKLQEITDDFINKINELLELKESDIMTV